MPCNCGAKAKNKFAVEVARSVPLPILGEFGMVKVEFLGDVSIWPKGEETCHEYEFSPERSTVWVDKRDVSKLVALTYNDQPLFKVT